MARSDNHLTLAVAGSGKTRSIVEACVSAPATQRSLVLTYTTANQAELRSRLAVAAGNRAGIDVSGWFSFLIRNFVRPFLPYVFRGKRVQGFDFKSPPQTYAKTTEWLRYFNEQAEVRKVHLPQLVIEIERASGGAGVRRLAKLYDTIFIDEVQDLAGYDLEVVKLLIDSKIGLDMVGDIRQAILCTNQQEKKNKKYQYMRIWEWFREQEKAGNLAIDQSCRTWRCAPAVAVMADSIFDGGWGFEPTISMNTTTTPHDGIFLVKPEHVDAYMRAWDPLPLRHSVTSGRPHDHLPFVNFGLAKGLCRERVLIFPTVPIRNSIRSGSLLTSSQAAPFYVAVTRAEQSVALILEDAGTSLFPVWEPDSAM